VRFLAAAGAVVSHFFAGRRDRENRRIEFLKKIGEFKTKIRRCNIPQKLGDMFPGEVARFGGECIALERDLWFWKKRKLRRLCNDIIKMTDARVTEIANGELVGKTELLNRIEKIISIL
jgi:hypothetical protein